MKLSVCLMAWLGLAASACTSNPTPHPAVDAGPTAQTGGDDTGNMTDFGPDDDNDGIADCLEVNGTWNGETCNTFVPNDGDAIGGDGTPEPDAGDGDDGTGADGYDDDGHDDDDDDDDGADAP